MKCSLQLRRLSLNKRRLSLNELFCDDSDGVAERIGDVEVSATLNSIDCSQQDSQSVLLQLETCEPSCLPSLEITNFSVARAGFIAQLYDGLFTRA